MKLRHLLALLAVVALPLGVQAADKRIVLIAGKPSHPPGMHEFRAGMLLLQQCLAQTPGIKAEVYTNGWPDSDAVFDGAAAVVIYCDGGAKHPAIEPARKQLLDALAKKGVGLGFMHYGVEVPADNGGGEFKRWIGGYYETNWSCNPMWSPDYQKFPDHPVARGVKPFSNHDEWYFNMRWNENEKGITPILTAVPSDKVRGGTYVHPKGPYQHIIAAAGRTETMMWVIDRADGGRGFGFTGGHTHAHWGNDNQRKVVLNAILWTAKVDVPKNGVESKVSADLLAANLDPKPAPKKK
ncbi:MAG: ThuA domain-containing protein [Verrucomicrobia bacterium]|nr:ThuA domain-containing protein [Verrucomicrobiota bacterium]